MKRAQILVLAFLVYVTSAKALADAPASVPPRAAAKPTPVPRAEARSLAQRGDAQFEDGRCDKAIALWRDAYGRFRAPTLLLRIARCQAILGKVVDAAATLADISREPVDPAEPNAFGEARREAARELTSLRARIATVKISLQRDRDVTGAPRIEIDQESFSDEKVVAAVDPGQHVLRVRTSEVIWERAVTLDDGEVQSYQLSLWAETTPPAPRPQQQVGLAIASLGLASLAVGLGLAASSGATSRHLADVCGRGGMAQEGAGWEGCSAREQDAIDSLRSSSHAAELTLTSGAVLLAASALVLLVDRRPKDKPPRLRVSASVWPLGLGSGLPSRSGVGVWLEGVY